MCTKRLLTLAVVAALLAAQFPSAPSVAAQPAFLEQTFQAPVDAFSVKMSAVEFSYSTRTTAGWSAWKTYRDDGDTGIGGESELIMLPLGVTALRVQGVSAPADIHPISVSHEPVKTHLASVSATSLPSVVSRSDWGAEEKYLFDGTPDDAVAGGDQGKSDNGVTGTQTTSQRVKDCQTAQQNYPSEFSYSSVVTKDAQGRPYRWPLQYSKEIKLLVVHHAALVVKDDPRPAVERVRALYKYHAITKGWGDVGYNFIVDESGTVYEGRMGGTSVAGGHAYCNNVGTIGIVLMGNFEIEQPTDAQAKGLQRLLASLARDYHIDTTKSVQFHGKKFDAPIVRHKDLLSTLCPGYYLAEAFGQIVQNVRTGNVNAPVLFPKLSSSSSSSAPATVLNSSDALKPAPGISFIGRNVITINPGGKQRLSFSYTADASGAYEGKKVADVKLSSQNIKLWVDDGIDQVPVTKGILLSTDLPAYETASFQLIVQAPMNEGSYAMDIGGVHFTISVSGRRARTGEYVNPFTGNPALIVRPLPARKVTTTISSRVRPHTRGTMQSSSVSSSSASSVSSISRTPFTPDDAKPIRIRLSAGAAPSITFVDNGVMGTTLVRAGMTFDLLPRGNQCEVHSRGERVTSGDIVRFQSSVSDTLSVRGFTAGTRSFVGVLECRIVDGVIALINELPLERYMQGISEEPDTEPYEKQRAFAIAARSYAAYYMDTANRKFPGKPYDGSDDPAVFQAYAGIGYQSRNPEWVRAVNSTSNQVLFYKGAILKPAYFSSDDGRTRSPDEIGWRNFPNAEVFASKPDPWCSGQTLRGHGVGMSGCGAHGQAKEGRSAEQILAYYYPGARLGER